MTPAPGRQRVVAVTGGGGGIGAAIAEALGRAGDLVVTLDPLVTLDGAERLPASEETAAGRILAAGGSALATDVSVTDRDAVFGLFERLVDEHGGLDAVVNVAGITRPTTFARGSEDDWRAVLEVHLDGYRNVLDAALPIMAAAGHGHVLGVTSGSGWRAADTGAYGCAKRAVASLTWQLGRHAPPGVVVNALSPIAVTRMVTEALRRAGGGSAKRSSATGGLSLRSMPQPDELGPLGAHLVSDDFTSCRGQVVYAGGSEVAVIEPPRLLEVVRTDDVASLPHLLEAVSADALVPAEAGQATTGATNPRFGPIFDVPGAAAVPPTVVRTCVVVADRPAVADAVAAALEAREVTCTTITGGDVPPGFAGAAVALASIARREGSLDAVVVAGAEVPPSSGKDADADPAGRGSWARVLAEHASVAEGIRFDAAWAQAVAGLAADAGGPVRLVTLTEAIAAGGHSRGQASAQLARAARPATDDRVSAFAISLEGPAGPDLRAVGEIAAHLVCSPAAAGLSGAELVVDPGWLGLRSHPRPGGSITYGGPELPDWLDGTLGALVHPPSAPSLPSPPDGGTRPTKETP